LSRKSAVPPVYLRSELAAGEPPAAARRLVRIPIAVAGEVIPLAIHLWDAAGPDAPAVVCVHGLSRNGRDFDALAATLGARYRVACIDMPGRGDSGWLSNPAGYGWDNDLLAACAAIDTLALGPVHWVGTSMGGRIGLQLAASQPQRVRSLVLNDVGAELDGRDLGPIRAAASESPAFASPAEALAWARTRFAACGIRTEERWQHLVRTSIEPDGDGTWRLRFDPRAITAMPAPVSVSLWDQYDAVKCPVFVVRGAESRLLSPVTCRRMAVRGPRAQWIEVPGAGHAPDLEGEDRIGPVAEFIDHAQGSFAASR
jgi:pimeloyl-ACP methyl ester carboxylesterase